MPWQVPEPKYNDDDYEYFHFKDPFRWPYMKFDELEREDLFGTLHDRFNTTSIAIQDKEAWHADVVQLLRESDTVEELFAKLEKRKAQRLEELVSAITSLNSVGWAISPSQTLRRLGFPLRNLHESATVFHATELFLAMSSISDEAHRECERERIARIERAEVPSHRQFNSDGKRCDTPKNDAAICSAEDAAERSRCTTPEVGSSTETHYCSSGNKKRKRSAADASDHHEKRQRAAAPHPSPEDWATGTASPPVTGGSESTAASVSHHDSEDNSQSNHGIPTQESHSPLSSLYSTDIDADATLPPPAAVASKKHTKSPPPPQIEEESDAAGPDSHVITGEAISTTMESPSPESDFGFGPQLPESCQTQLPSTRVQYEALGWKYDNRVESRAILDGEQHQIQDIH